MAHGLAWVVAYFAAYQDMGRVDMMWGAQPGVRRLYSSELEVAFFSPIARVESIVRGEYIQLGVKSWYPKGGGAFMGSPEGTVVFAPLSPPARTFSPEFRRILEEQAEAMRRDPTITGFENGKPIREGDQNGND